MMTPDEISRFFSEEYVKRAFQSPDWPAGTEVVCYCRSTYSRDAIEQIAQQRQWKIVEYVHIDELPIDKLFKPWQFVLAKREGLVLPSDKPNELDYLNLREKMTIPEVPLPTKAPDLSFKIKISKRRLRKIRQMAIWKKPRLPRKLKKAARHADLDMMDPLFKTDALSDRDAVSFTIEYDMRVRIHPASYPRTKWVHRLTRIVRRMMARQHRRFIQHQLNQQYLDQHPGMLTYDDAPSNPAGHNKNLYAGNEFILDKDSRQRLANILINKEEKNE